ncbi:MAG: heme-binding protein [Lysobacterales bacterium]
MPLTRILSLALALMALQPVEQAMATEQVPYVVEQTLGEDVEIRRYDPSIVAETLIERGDYRDAGNEGFRRLADYIFGNNRTRARIAMTAPVAMAPQSERIAMTAPVDASAVAGGWRMAFYMPAGYTLETLPLPVDERVQLRAVPGRRVAALRFSGRGTEAQFAEHTAELLTTLVGAGLSPVGQPWTARYNAPWVLPPLRRNEAMVELAP